jgi:hypothetical protein
MSSFERDIDVRWSNRAAGGGPGGFARVPERAPTDRHSGHIQRYQLPPFGERTRW